MSFGNRAQGVAIGYGRRFDEPEPVLTDADRAKQNNRVWTVTEIATTKAVQNS